jgi:glutamine synthetase
MFKNSAEIFDYIKKNDVKLIDVRFIDLPGIQHHFNVPVESFDESVFKDGLMFDGSSIRGFQSIHESDMKLLPVPSSAYLDPFRKEKTLIILFSVHNPDDNTPYSRDPRGIVAKAVDFMRSTGIADTAFFAPEAEFYVFDRIRFLTGMNQAFHHIDSYEGAWNTGIEEDADGTPNRGYRTRIKGGYFPVSPTDQFADLRDEMVMNLGKVGLLVERAHHEVGTAGQMEINYRFSDILTAGDELMKFKYIIKNTAWAAGKTATFMPKPLFGDNGSGMHVHQSLWKDGKPLFWGDGYIGGLLKHAPSLLAFTNPTVNSYKRLVPGYEAPVNLVYSARNRSACIRIPITGSNPKAKRIEFRCPDPSSNPYLAFAAMLMAGIDGIQNKIEPPKPVDKDLYELEGDEAKAIPQVPGSLDAVLDNLERDNEFLTRGGVFTKDLIDTWIDFKRKQEVDYVRLRPHPAEFELYYDL